MKKIKIENIRLDGTQSRITLDQERVQEYADLIKTGTVFPAIDVFFDGSDYWMADGFHRSLAAQRAGKTMIDATVHRGSQREALLHSVGANDEHGIRRTNADKRYAVALLLRDEEWSGWSDREIARRCKVQHQLVGNVRRSLDDSPSEKTYWTKHGTQSTMKTGKIGRKRKSVLQGDPIQDECEDCDTDESRWHRSCESFLGDVLSMRAFWKKEFGNWKKFDRESNLITLAKQAEVEFSKLVKLLKERQNG